MAVQVEGEVQSTGGGMWGVSSRCRVQQGDSCREAVPEPAGPGT